jgi:hypothetical protein
MSAYAFYVAYDGPALATSQMAVRDLAPALLALSDAFDEANKIVNNDKAIIRLDVKGSFKTGCFGIDLVGIQGIARSVLNFFSGDDIQSVATIAGLLGFSTGGAIIGLIDVLRWIRNRKITKIEIKEKKARIFIGDKYLDTEEAIIEMLRNTRIRKAFETAINTPLQQEGIESFAYTDNTADDKNIVIIPKEEAYCFLAPLVEEEILDEREFDTTVQIVGVSFQEKNKWRFSDGMSVFHAEIIDAMFIALINNHEIAFAKDDILKVHILEKQKLTNTGIKTERVIQKVLSHRSAAVQLSLPIYTA